MIDTLFGQLKNHLDEKEYESAYQVAEQIDEYAVASGNTQMIKEAKFIKLNTNKMLMVARDRFEPNTIVALWYDFSNYVEGFEEYFEELSSLMSSVNSICKRITFQHLNEFEKDPALDKIGELNNQVNNVLLPAIGLLLQLSASPAKDRLEENSGMEYSDAADVYYKPKCKFDLSEIHYQYYESGCRVFDTAQRLLDENRSGNVHSASAIGSSVIEKCAIAIILMGYAIDSKGVPAEVTFSHLGMQAQVLEYLLNECVYPNGKAVSIACNTDSRRTYIAELEEIYAKMQEIDPQFDKPVLPDEKPIMNQDSGGCYVATCVYGSYDCPQVWTLRRFRDDTLAMTWYGRTFIKTYYAVSPALVKRFGHTQWFKKLWRGKLDRIVNKLNTNGIEDTPYNDRVW